MRPLFVRYLLVMLVVGACAATTFAQGTLIARYHMDETSWSGAGSVTDDVGGYHGTPAGSPLPTTSQDDPARSGSLGTCGYGVFSGNWNGGSTISISGLPVSTSSGAQTSVAFWMYWDGTDNVMPIGWDVYDLYFYQPPTGGQAAFGFNTANSDIYGIPSAGLANGWHHVAAVFTNGDVTQNAIYIDGAAQNLSQMMGVPTPGNAAVGSSFNISGWGFNGDYRFTGSRIDEVEVFNGALTQAQVIALYGETHACAGASAVPSMSPAGVIALITLLLAAGLVLLRRRI